MLPKRYWPCSSGICLRPCCLMPAFCFSYFISGASSMYHQLQLSSLSVDQHCLSAGFSDYRLQGTGNQVMVTLSPCQSAETTRSIWDKRTLPSLTKLTYPGCCLLSYGCTESSLHYTVWHVDILLLAEMFIKTSALSWTVGFYRGPVNHYNYKCTINAKKIFLQGCDDELKAVIVSIHQHYHLSQRVDRNTSVAAKFLKCFIVFSA